MTGDVVPGPLASYADYQRLLASIDAELGDLDRDKILIGNPWINARGAIARFDRMAIELRLLDTQECPRADVAICEAVAAATRALVEERWVSFAEQRETPTAPLRATLDAAVVEGPAAPPATPFLATALGAPGAQTLGEIWRRFLAEAALSGGATAVLDTIRSEGTLAQRILAATGPAPSHEALHAVSAELAACLATGRMLGA
jgi:hypothetical protein